MLDEVLGIFLERLIVLVARLRLHLLSLPQAFYCLAHVVLGESGVLHDARCRRVDREQSQQQRFHTHELVAHFLRDVSGFLQYLRRAVAEVGLSALHFRQSGNLAVEHRFYLVGVSSEFPEYV